MLPSPPSLIYGPDPSHSDTSAKAGTRVQEAVRNRPFKSRYPFEDISDDSGVEIS